MDLDIRKVSRGSLPGGIPLSIQAGTNDPPCTDVTADTVNHRVTFAWRIKETLNPVNKNGKGTSGRSALYGAG